MSNRLSYILITLKKNYFLLFPSFCIVLWALFSIFFIKEKWIFDFSVFYNSGQNVLYNPTHLYNLNNRFFYLPSFALLFAISFSLLPFLISYYIWFLLNILFAVFIIIEFEKILTLFNVSKAWLKLIFLIIISNGFLIYYQFFSNQTKFLISAIFLFVLRRDIQFKKEGKRKSLNHYFLNYFLLIFAIGMNPVLIFFLLIYIFQDIKICFIFNKENIKKICIAIIIFLIQNILFVIFPSLIFNFLNAAFNDPENSSLFHIFYLNEIVSPSKAYTSLIIYSMIIINFLITLILILKNRMKIEKKFGYLALTTIFFEVYEMYKSLVILLPLVLILFISYTNQFDKKITFIKENKILLTGVISIFGLYITPATFLIYRIIPIVSQYPYNLLIGLRWILLLSIMVITLLFLHIKTKSIDKMHKNNLSIKN